ncbi:MBL fold metallo-hydrolase [Neptuniibacter sp. QD34_54]|uniref:MBL fold metallo-hydrolase n=1 Tax=Neptuniibacter sp. QD34_54 TaxID=3398208 RepID=UPI0039F585AA
MPAIEVNAFYQSDIGSVSYIIADPESRECAVIDPVLGFNPVSARIDTTPAKALVGWIEKHGYTTRWLLETHIHADHLSAAGYIKQCVGGETAIGSGVVEVLEKLIPLFNLEGRVPNDGSQFQHLLENGAELPLGNKTIRVLHSPGHTPACVSYLIENSLFLGDTLFMPDVGSARCDFPGGDAKALYQSIQRLYSLPGSTTVYVCHDYPSEQRPQPCWQSTIEEQQRLNIHLPGQISEAKFIKMREQRDKGLPLPEAMLAVVQLNLMAGHLPAPDINGRSYLKIPINVF